MLTDRLPDDLRISLRWEPDRPPEHPAAVALRLLRTLETLDAVDGSSESWSMPSVRFVPGVADVRSMSIADLTVAIGTRPIRDADDRTRVGSGQSVTVGNGRRVVRVRTRAGRRTPQITVGPGLRDPAPMDASAGPVEPLLAELISIWDAAEAEARIARTVVARVAEAPRA